MTFTTKVKNEVTKLDLNYIERYNELAAIIRYAARWVNGKMIITTENVSVANQIYKSIKQIFKLNAEIIVRNQKRFSTKVLYILTVSTKLDLIKNSFYLNENYLPKLQTREEKASFLRGIFLANGSINNPRARGYHFELGFKTLTEANLALELLQELEFTPKIIERNHKYMVYVKHSEEISDLLKLFQAPNCLFEFEDIRIYRDHKNMVNRLNNCEIANQAKSYLAAQNQLTQIEYLHQNDLIGLLDEKTRIIITYRLKYPTVSFQKLATLIQNEAHYKIGKSGINHHFIKIKNLIAKHKKPK